MGYTRYWERTDKRITEEFLKEAKEIIAKSEELGIHICGPLGDGPAEVEMSGIAFNGNGACSADHESFVLTNMPEFSFCKTARKPYDYTVRRVLQAAEKHGIVTDVSDDGENDEIISDLDFMVREAQFFREKFRKKEDQND